MLNSEMATVVDTPQVSAFVNPTVTLPLNTFNNIDKHFFDELNIAAVADVSDTNISVHENSLHKESTVQTAASPQNIAPVIANPCATYISTLVFFDLETTGLGTFVGKSNVQVTEISMIAVERNEFMQSKFPDLRDVRITHKLSMCIRPRCSVSPAAARITGLDNRNLFGQEQFDQNTAVAIMSFLLHLRKPVCLLAHNGNTFDFPLLKSEFKRLNISFPSEVRIADTLVGFRSIGARDLPMGQKTPKSVKCKNGSLSLSLENLHIYFFGKKHQGNHSSEGDCIALAKVCHKMKDNILPWIDQNCKNLDSVAPMW